MAKTKVSDEVREKRRAARMQPRETVWALVEELVPDLHEHMQEDGEWLWYCGPSLQGDGNIPTREALKDIGFLWAKGGHVIEETGDEGSWGHCCGHPVRFRRRDKDKTAEDDSANDSNQVEDTQDAFSALSRLAV